MAENNTNHAPVAASLNLDDERAKFEAWALSPEGPWMARSLTLESSGGKYVVEEVQEQWKCWQAARRTPPAEVSADTLPALPGRVYYWNDLELYERADVQEYARQAVAPYAEQIKKLERELAERKQVQSIGSIEDYAQFHTLLGSWMGLRHHYQDDSAPVVLEAWRKFIAYIDARPAGTAPETRSIFEYKRIGEFTVQVTFRSARACGKFIEQIAATPSLSTGTEESK